MQRDGPSQQDGILGRLLAQRYQSGNAAGVQRRARPSQGGSRPRAPEGPSRPSAARSGACGRDTGAVLRFARGQNARARASPLDNGLIQVPCYPSRHPSRYPSRYPSRDSSLPAGASRPRSPEDRDSGPRRFKLDQPGRLGESPTRSDSPAASPLRVRVRPVMSEASESDSESLGPLPVAFPSPSDPSGSNSFEFIRMAFRGIPWSECRGNLNVRV